MDIMDKNAPSIEVGTRLLQLRQERNLSVRSLARLSGLSANALSMIERNRSSPSVSTLHRLAEALEVPVTAFFRVESTREQVVFRKAAERSRVSFVRGIMEDLGGESFTGHVEPFMITLESGATSGPHGMLHTGHEFVLCLRGLLDYQVEDQKYSLEAGDSLLFAAHLRHRWRNPGKTVTSAVIVLSGFEEGDTPGDYHRVSGMREVSSEQEPDSEEI